MASNLRQKRQEDETESDDQSVDELCLNRPPDEYFRLSTEGDCRDVVRYCGIADSRLAKVVKYKLCTKIFKHSGADRGKILTQVCLC